MNEIIDIRVFKEAQELRETVLHFVDGKELPSVFEYYKDLIKFKDEEELED